MNVAKELRYAAKMIKAFSGIEYYYSPAQYDNKAFILISLFSLKMLQPQDAVMLLKKATNDINSFVRKYHCTIMEQKTQRIFGKDCIATIMSVPDGVEQQIVNQLKAKIFYHTRFDK